MTWFWYFLFYSFAGFGLEVMFARLTNGRPQRKCLLLFPLCPVYGLGACGILLLPAQIQANPLTLFLFGALVSTAAEYSMALFYEKILGVAFWDYRDLPGNLAGRVCLPFSLAWGLLALPLVDWLHPRIQDFPALIPLPVTAAVALAFGADVLISSAMLRTTGDLACLNWYAAKEK